MRYKCPLDKPQKVFGHVNCNDGRSDRGVVVLFNIASHGQDLATTPLSCPNQ